MKIKVVKVRDVPEPKYATIFDAGLDLHAAEEITLEPGSRTLIPTGLKMEIPYGYTGLIWDRSGLAAKNGISTLAGVIDSGYRGEIKVVLINLGNERFIVEKHMRVAQILFQPVEQVKLEFVDKIGKTDRDEGGFGSTGV